VPSSLSQSVTLGEELLLTLCFPSVQKYTFGQAKGNDPQLVKNFKVEKGSHTQKPDQGAN